MPLRFVESAAEAYAFPLTIRHLLDSARMTAADQLIVYRDQHTYRYREFFDRIGRLASLLQALGARQGMTVAVMDWDSHRYLEAYFAIPMMGAVLQTVNTRLPAAQVAYTLQHAQAHILLVHRDFFELARSILPKLPGIRMVIALVDGADEAPPTWAIGEYEALLASAAADFAFEDFDENAIATTFYTTGTTGVPKGACFTHRQLVLHTLVGISCYGGPAQPAGFGYGDVYMPLTPMFHVHAWGVPYLATALGVKQVYPGRYEPALLCRLRHEHRVTYSHCVPTILQMIFQAADQTGADLSGWKMTIGGSALTQSLCAEGRRRGMQIHAGYGMSETGPTIAKAQSMAAAEDEARLIAELTPAGTTVPLVSAQVVDENMHPLPRDGVTRGELVLRAPWLTGCYTGDAPASAALWRGGWMHTQDIATIDPHGVIRIRDRLKDVIKSGGEWIDSLQLEELLASADGVGEIAVIAIPDAQWGERAIATVVPTPHTTVTLDTLNVPIDKAVAAGSITRYARLKRVELVAQIPRTSVGKIDKKAMRAQFASDGTPGSGESSGRP